MWTCANCGNVKNADNEDSCSYCKTRRSNDEIGNQLIQKLALLGIDEEVCNSLQDLNFLDIDDLKNIINLEAEEIADILNVTVKKVIPAKFKDRVNLFLRRIEPVEGRAGRVGRNDALLSSIARNIDRMEPVGVKSDTEEQTPYWACQRCTVHNPIDAKSCSICSSTREDSSESLKGPISTDEQTIKQKSSPQDISKRSFKYGVESLQEDGPWPSQPFRSQQEDEVLKPIVFDSAKRYVYWLLIGTGTASHHKHGAASACTTMSVQAAFSLLRNVCGKHMPFGITSDVLDGILKVGIAMYHKSSHRDVLEVLDSSAHLSRALIHESMVYLNLSDPLPALTIGNDLKLKYGTNICAIITCQAQSLCLFYEYQSDYLILFDSHSRMYNGVHHGAAMLFFERMDALIAYLKLIFPAPDIRYQSDMVLAQADFLRLRSAITVLPGDNLESIPYDSSLKTQIHDIGGANPIAQVNTTIFAEQARLETELKHEKVVAGDLKKKFEQLEKASNYWSAEAQRQPSMKIPSNPQYLKAIPQPMARVIGKIPAHSYKDDELIARQLMEEEMRVNNDMIYAKKKKIHESDEISSKGISRSPDDSSQMQKLPDFSRNES